MRLLLVSLVLASLPALACQFHGGGGFGSYEDYLDSPPGSQAQSQTQPYGSPNPMRQKPGAFFKFKRAQTPVVAPKKKEKSETGPSKNVFKDGKAKKVLQKDG